MGLQQKNTRQARRERAILVIFYLISMISVFLFLGLAFFIIRQGLQGFRLSFFTTKTSVLKGTTGILEYLQNTILLLIITLPVTAVMGVAGAVYLCEYVESETVAENIQFAVEILAGIPSIVFGLFGMVFFGEVLHMGYSLLTGAATLTIMLLPIMIENTKESLQKVPREYKLSALGLGAGKWYMLRTILLPCSVSGIKTGLTLSAGKLLGETAALLFTAGSKSSLAVAIFMFVGKGQLEEAYCVALLLLAMVIGLNFLLQAIKK